ncbi:hypothetical protein SO802_008014 [Lithocarpus litseifolius]|uniref:R13L1/DRL21-like LRR repeat region domain-containing protein n=1 Tax=Lithocarpus litseifolius TaxID=425828 RepID=A0AAW2DVZ8_9ROSI
MGGIRNFFIESKSFQLVVEEEGCYFLLRIFERGKYFMRSVFMGKNAAKWLMTHIEHIVVGARPKQFFSLREGDTAFTLQRSSNSFGQFLLLTELKVGGSRRSIVIPAGREKYGWRAFGLELRKILFPSQYAAGGVGLPRFIPQVLRHKLEAPTSKTFAEAVKGSHGRVENRTQLGFTDKGKLTQVGEERRGANPRLTGAKVVDFPVSKPAKMELGGMDRTEQCINEEVELGEQNLADFSLRFPSSILNSKAADKGKKSDVGRPCWTGRGLIVEVDVKGRRQVFWDRKKGRVKKLSWVSRAMDRDCNKGGPKDSLWATWGINQAKDKLVVGQGTSPLLADTLLGPFNSGFSGPSCFEVGECSSPGMEADGPGSGGFSSDEPTTAPGKLEKVSSSRFAAEKFLSDLFLSFSRVGFLDVGVNDGVNGGWVRQDQTNLAVIPTKAVCAIPGTCELVDVEKDFSDTGLGGEDFLSVPLTTITPSGLALSADYGSEAAGGAKTLDISKWVKYRLPGFSKLVGLPLCRHETLCIALLQWIERETEAAKVLNRNITALRKAVICKEKGKRELRNLISSVNYDGYMDSQLSLLMGDIIIFHSIVQMRNSEKQSKVMISDMMWAKLQSSTNQSSFLKTWTILMSLIKDRKKGCQLKEEEEESRRRMESDVAVLNALEPPSHLEKLSILYVMSITVYTNWMRSLTNLKSLNISCCFQPRVFATFGVYIVFAKNMKKLGDEFLGIESENKSKKDDCHIINIFPNLSVLQIERLESCEEWVGMGGKREEVEEEKDSGLVSDPIIKIMPQLERLTISDCHNLKCLTDYLRTNPLQELRIYNSPILEQRCER